MATKRTKADKEQRQADQLEKKSERRPEQGTSKRKVRKDFSRAALSDVESRPRKPQEKVSEATGGVLR